MTTNEAVSELQAEVNRLQHELSAVHQDEGDLIYVGQYLCERLVQLGVTQIFGVPGDFNLGFLDFIEDHPKLEWVGNCNELNAAYAADGYARVKEGLGVLVTTFGVGELSAANGQAGAFSEHVPMLHIAGVPNTSQLKNKPLLHHTLGDGRFDAYTKAAQQFSIADAQLMEKSSACAQIDRVITSILTQARPGYLTLPTDIAYEKVPSGRLKTPLKSIPPPNDAETEEWVIKEIVKLVKEAEENVVILVDACTIRHYVREEVAELAEKTHFPVYSAPMGKTAISEQHNRYGGVYIGSISAPEVKEKVEEAKLILSIGSLKSDFNTGGFTYKIPTSRTVELHSTHTQIQYAKYDGISMKHLLPKLTAALEQFKEGAKQLQIAPYDHIVPEEKSDIISHEWFWPRVAHFFRPKDVIVSETGTANFGLLDVPFPKDSVFVAQILWGSIGWSTGSALGAALAARDRQLGRTILFIGDGSLQLTAQELTTMMRHKLNPIVFVLNNKGYTIERYLHGKTRKYNDVVNWKYTHLLSTFGGEEGVTCQSYTVNNKEEAEKLLTDEAFIKADKMQLVEVMMDQFDAPRSLKLTAELSSKVNKYAL